MKKISVIFLSIVLVLGLCACGQKKTSEIKEPASVSQSEDVTNNSDAESIGDTQTEEIAESSVTSTSMSENEAIFEAKSENVSEPEKKQDENAVSEENGIYTQILDAYHAVLVNEFEIDNYCPMTLGACETTIGSPSDSALNGVGYAIKDINADGRQELLIMAVANPGETPCFGNRIVALYTDVNDEPRFLKGGWARNRIFLLNDGRIYNEGSSGVNDSSFETFRLMENTDLLEQLDSKDSKSDDFEKQREEMNKFIETVEIKSFADYEVSSDYPNSAQKFWSAVYVDPAENTLAFAGKDEYSVSDSEYARKLVFYTPSEVYDFRFCSLEPLISADGELRFIEEKLYKLDELHIDKAVTISLEFPGDTPHYGISYKDALGNVRRYAICESGFDGSIFLLQYEVTQEEKICEAYAEYIEYIAGDCASLEELAFATVDVNNDGVRELLYAESSVNAAGVNVCFYDKGAIINVGPCGCYGSIKYASLEGKLISIMDNMDYMNYELIAIGEKFESTVERKFAIEPNSEDDSFLFFVDDKEVTQNEYADAFSKLQDMEIKSLDYDDMYLYIWCNEETGSVKSRIAKMYLEDEPSRKYDLINPRAPK